MATKTPTRPRRSPLNGALAQRAASIVFRVLVVVVFVGAVSVLAIRQYPRLFFAVAEYLPRKPAVAIANDPSNDEMFFKYGGIGNEANEGLPYKIWAVLPKVCPQLLNAPVPGDKPVLGYRQFGFLFEDGKDVPIGMSRVSLGVGGLGVEQVAINCSVCHVQTYRAPGASQSKLFIGGVANQLNSLAYVRFVSNCAATPGFTDKTLEAMREHFAMKWAERQLYRTVLIPMTLAGINERVRLRYAWTWRRPAWGPGRVDPFNPPKFTYLRQPIDNTIGNSDMMPPWNAKAKEAIPRRPDRPRVLWHWDGLSSDLREVILNSALGDGMTAQGYAAETIERLLRYLRALKSPKASELAGLQVDEALRKRGEDIFNARCANCHGWSGMRFMTIIPRSEVATDPNRMWMWTKNAQVAYNAYDSKGRWDFKHFEHFEGYLAQPLEGIWLTGPYLHNGSVPSLADLLKPAGERSSAFVRGSDELDFERGGYRSPPCGPGTYRGGGFCYDTAQPGNSNVGHDGPEYGTDMSPAERRAVVHYLLTL